jgi:hypothetical protein
MNNGGHCGTPDTLNWAASVTQHYRCLSAHGRRGTPAGKIGADTTTRKLPASVPLLLPT